MTRAAFLAAYRAHLVEHYDWARFPERLDRFMISVERTISTKASTWNHHGDSVRAAWRAIGGKGSPTLTALRALPGDPP